MFQTSQVKSTSKSWVDSDKVSLFEILKEVFICSKKKQDDLRKRRYIDKADLRIGDELSKLTEKPLIFNFDPSKRKRICIEEINHTDLMAEITNLKIQLKINHIITSEWEDFAINACHIKNRQNTQPREKQYITKFVKSSSSFLRSQTKFRYKLVIGNQTYNENHEEKVPSSTVIDLQNSSNFFVSVDMGDQDFYKKVFSSSLAQESDLVYYQSGGYHSGHCISLQHCYKITLKQDKVISGNIFIATYDKLRKSFNQARQSHCSILVNKMLYILGGQETNENKKTLLKSVECYNIQTREWSNKASMNFPRRNFSVFLFRKKIWAYGHNKYLESYCINTDKWEVEMELPISIVNFGQLACDDNSFCILGGSDPQVGKSLIKGLRNSVYKIDLDLKKTTMTKNLIIPRATKAVFMPNDAAIIMGGNDTSYRFNIETQHLVDSQKDKKLKCNILTCLDETENKENIVSDIDFSENDENKILKKYDNISNHKTKCSCPFYNLLDNLQISSIAYECLEIPFDEERSIKVISEKENGKEQNVLQNFALQFFQDSAKRYEYFLAYDNKLFFNYVVGIDMKNYNIYAFTLPTSFKNIVYYKVMSMKDEDSDKSELILVLKKKDSDSLSVLLIYQYTQICDLGEIPYYGLFDSCYNKGKIIQFHNGEINTIEEHVGHNHEPIQHDKSSYYEIDCNNENSCIVKKQIKTLLTFQTLNLDNQVETQTEYKFDVWDFKYWKNIVSFTVCVVKPLETEEKKELEIFLYVFDGRASTVYSFYPGLSLMVRHRMEISNPGMVMQKDVAINCDFLTNNNFTLVSKSSDKTRAHSFSQIESKNIFDIYADSKKFQKKIETKQKKANSTLKESEESIDLCENMTGDSQNSISNQDIEEIQENKEKVESKEIEFISEDEKEPVDQFIENFDNISEDVQMNEIKDKVRFTDKGDYLALHNFSYDKVKVTKIQVLKDSLETISKMQYADLDEIPSEYPTEMEDFEGQIIGNSYASIEHMQKVGFANEYENFDLADESKDLLEILSESNICMNTYRYDPQIQNELILSVTGNQQFEELSDILVIDFDESKQTYNCLTSKKSDEAPVIIKINWDENVKALKFKTEEMTLVQTQKDKEKLHTSSIETLKSEKNTEKEIKYFLKYKMKEKRFLY